MDIGSRPKKRRKKLKHSVIDDNLGLEAGELEKIEEKNLSLWSQNKIVARNIVRACIFAATDSSCTSTVKNDYSRNSDIKSLSEVFASCGLEDKYD